MRRDLRQVPSIQASEDDPRTSNVKRGNRVGAMDLTFEAGQFDQGKVGEFPDRYGHYSAFLVSRRISDLALSLEKWEEKYNYRHAEEDQTDDGESQFRASLPPLNLRLDPSLGELFHS